MFGINFKIVKVAANQLSKTAKGIQWARETEVAIGAFADSGSHNGVSNADLLYLHCNGSPANNIPPRDVLKAGLEDPETKKQMKQHLRKGVMLALIFGPEAGAGEYEKAGMIGAASVQKQFGAIPPPNAPSTVRRKGFNSPLIETGSLRSSISYQVRKKA